MKFIPALVLLLVLSFSAQAQFGVNGKYVSAGENWQLTPSTTGQETSSDLFDNGWSVGVDYWFRLRNKRIEFLPELNYTYLNNAQAAYTENEANIYSFFFNTNIYFMDLVGDCDCPTWSKEGPTLKKGLFLQVSPGVSYWDMSVGTDEVNLFAERHAAFSIGGGLGFDLGLSDLVTFTPMINVRYFSKITLENALVLDDMVDGDRFVSDEAANPLLISAGIRLGIRLDE